MSGYSSMLNELSRKIKERSENLTNNIITLSSGAIFLSITFLDKFAKSESYYTLIILSWVSLLITILSGLRSKKSTIHQDNRMRKELLKCLACGEDKPIVVNPTRLENLIELIFYSSFISGLVLLMIFSILNLQYLQ